MKLIAATIRLDADPIKDIHNTTKISEVFLAGKEFDRAALDQMLRPDPTLTSTTSSALTVTFPRWNSCVIFLQS
jgi:hypothetical protein